MASPVDIPPDARILVVDLAYIGDLLMSTPALRNLRRAFPQASIDILVAAVGRPMIERNDSIDRVITTQIKSGGLAALRREAKWVAEEGYDLAVCFHRGHGSLLMLKMAGVPKRIGFTNEGRGLLLTAGIPFQLRRHRAWNHLRLLEKCLGIDIDYKTPTELKVDPEATASMDAKLAGQADGRRLVGINPNAAWPTKRWLPGRFAEVGDAIAEMGFLPVLIGSQKEKSISSAVKAAMKTGALDLTGETTLEELAALLERCEVLVTNDSGPMHMAHALGVPVVSIFGPTDPKRCGPWQGAIKPIQVDIDCIRCYRKSCWHLSCMRGVNSKSVIEAVKNCTSISVNT